MRRRPTMCAAPEAGGAPGATWSRAVPCTGGPAGAAAAARPARRWLSLLVVLSVLCSLQLAALRGAPAAHAATSQAQAIVNAAQAMENAHYPYCFDGGNINGPTVGVTDSSSDGSYSNCSQIAKTGFDCTGLTLYAVYQGTGNAGLSHDGYQPGSGGGTTIGNKADLLPGDVVYFDHTGNNSGLGYIDHAGIYVGNDQILSAASEKWGIVTESFAWYASGGLNFVGGKRYWTGGATGGGASEGSFVSRQGSPEVYKIVGGAPVYVSTWDNMGGPQPIQTLDAGTFDSLPQYPASGTFIVASPGGEVYRVAGGAPLYVSTWDAFGGPQATTAVDANAISNAGAGGVWNHLRQQPADGTFVSTTGRREVYRFAGGAPLYVTTWDAFGGPQPTTGIDQADVDSAGTGGVWRHANYYPADGTTIVGSQRGDIYKVVGGAPFYLNSCDPGCGNPVGEDVGAIDSASNGNPALGHLRYRPADGTVLRAVETQAVYRVAGGAVIYQNTCDPGCTGMQDVNQYEIDHLALGHLLAKPADGTVLVGVPSGQGWAMSGGCLVLSHGPGTATTDASVQALACDKAAPTVMTSALPAVTLGSVTFDYSSNETGSGLKSYDIRYRRAPWNGTFGNYTYTSSWQGMSGLHVTLAPARGSTYCFSVRARDNAGNVSGWSGERCTAAPLDERSVTASSGWSQGRGSGYYASTISLSRAAGRTLTRTGVQAKRLWIVATTCSGCGSVQVIWGGKVIKAVSLNASATHYRVVIPVATFSGVGSSTVVLKTTSTARVYLDGLGVSRI